MGKVLLGWEMGLGIGYAVRLLDIARALSAVGHQPVLALHNLEQTWKLSIDDPFPVIQAPKVVGRLDPETTRHGFRPTGFADLMACNGFGSYDHLIGLVRSWCGTIDVVKPDLIVAEFSPLLALAAFGRIPAVLVSHGYSLPPVEAATFPRLTRRQPAYADQAKMLERVDRVQRRLGHPRPERLTTLYRGEARFILTLPELDPYRADRREPISGPLERLPDLAPELAAPRFYAYLAEDRQEVDAALRGLADSGLPGEIYVRDTSLNINAGYLAARGIELLPAAPALEDVVKRASVIVNHASINTVQSCIGAGRPQLLIPIKLDQAYIAAAAQEIGLGLNLAREVTPEKVTSAVQALAGDRARAETVAAYAEQVRARKQHGQLPRLVARCSELLG